MVCETTRKGAECAFMGKNGCDYSGGTCKPVVEECNGCGRSLEYETGVYCSASPDPAVKWKNGPCNLATHVSNREAETKVKINPLKASKRGG